ncbi:kinase-like domain-containing protein, partial [Helicostylum pulchrum]
MSNYPIKNLSVHFAKEQRVFQQLTNKNALLDALVSLYNNTSNCLHKQEDTTNKFIQLYKPIYHEINKSKVSLKDFNLLYKDFVEGAFGKVTIVKSIHDPDNIYAMKTLNKSYLNQQIDRSSPMEERLILSNTNEEWLPSLYASFQDKKNLYLVMEYAHGGDLENLMERRSYQFNEPEAKFYCAELILAVERVHQLGYMHRDIKPANILIDSKGHIKLGDLGSCISTDTTEDLFMVGTMPYISPEMCNFESSAYGAEVDWWSVGIVLYELLFGQTPFTGRDIQIQMNLLNPNLSIRFNPDIRISDEAKDLLTK